MFTLLYYHGREVFWMIWGIFGAVYLIQYVFKSMRKSPVTLKIGCLLAALVFPIISFENYMIFIGNDKEYHEIISILEKVFLWLIVLFLLFGGYQYVRRPGCDPKKRAAFFQILWTLIAAIIGFNLLIRI